MEKKFDLIIIGAGSAGLAAAQYGARANLSTLIIDAMAPGGQALLIADLENYPGFPEPLTGFEFSDRMEAQARKFGAEFLMEEVVGLEKKEETFFVKTAGGTVYTGDSVVFSTGAKHRKLGVPGEEEYFGKGVSYCASCDGPFFKGLPMLVVGGGDAACDEANYLSRLTDELTVIHRKSVFRAQKSIAKRVEENPKITVRFRTVLEEIHGDENGKVSGVSLRNTETGEVIRQEVKAVFIFIGTIPQTGLLPSVKKDEAGYIETNEFMETSLPGLYAVGDVRNTPFRQLAVAVGDGAIAAHKASQRSDELKGQRYI